MLRVLNHDKWSAHCINLLWLNVKLSLNPLPLLLNGETLFVLSLFHASINLPTKSHQCTLPNRHVTVINYNYTSSVFDWIVCAVMVLLLPEAILSKCSATSFRRITHSCTCYTMTACPYSTVTTVQKRKLPLSCTLKKTKHLF